MSYYCEDSKRYWLDSKKIWLNLEDLKGILQAFGFDRTPMARDLLAPAQPPTRVQGATPEHIEHIESNRQRMTDWGEWMLQKMVSQTTLSYEDWLLATGRTSSQDFITTLKNKRKMEEEEEEVEGNINPIPDNQINTIPETLAPELQDC